MQIAKLHQAEVTGVDCTGKLDLLRSLGFDHVIDYTREDFTKNGQLYDLILDVKTNRSLFAYLRALKPNGAYVTVGGSMTRLLEGLFWRPLMVRLRKKHFRVVALKLNKDLDYIVELFANGQVKPVIGKRYESLSEVPEALRYFASGKHHGKVVITLQPPAIVESGKR